MRTATSTLAWIELFSARYQAFLADRLTWPAAAEPDVTHWAQSSGLCARVFTEAAASCRRRAQASYRYAWQKWRSALALGIASVEPVPRAHLLSPEEAAAVQAEALVTPRPPHSP